MIAYREVVVNGTMAVMLVALMVSGFVSIVSLIRILIVFRRKPSSYSSKPVDLAAIPSVSVCIAARNEMHALAHCLESVLQSDYQKLEVLVLDDSSSDDTSLIIKSFAHAGVRFIAGSPLPEHWLGKNHAYATLIKGASGDYVFFIDADTIISPTTISQLIDRVESRNVAMASVVPEFHPVIEPSSVFGTLRYLWECLFSTTQRPAAASALWLIKKESYLSIDIELSDYKTSIQPERHLAKRFAKANEYELLSGRNYGTHFRKKLSSQYETARRLYYVLLKRSGIIHVVALGLLGVSLLPFAVLFIGPELRFYATCVVLVQLVGAYIVFRDVTYRQLAILRTAVLPILLIQEMLLILQSYIAYKTNRVTWKGRSISRMVRRADAVQLSEQSSRVK